MRVVSAAAMAACLFVFPPAAHAGQAAQTPAPAPQDAAPASEPQGAAPASEPRRAAPPPAPQGAVPAPAPQGDASAPAPQGAAPAGAQTPQGPQTVAAPPARAFTAHAGLLFNTVKADKTADFEKVIAAVQAALEKSTDPTIQAQARGWRVFKAAEAGPNNTVLYVFVLDPAVPGADYGFGHILGNAYTDPAELQMIWKLYTDSVTTGGTLLNLTPVDATAAPEATAPAPFAPPDAQPKMLPPDADPNRR